MSKKLITFSSVQKEKLSTFISKMGDITTTEIDEYINFCELNGVNPFSDEVRFLYNPYKKSQGRQYIFYRVTVKGNIKYAQYKDSFISAKAGLIYNGDLFEIDTVNGEITHISSDQKEKDIIGAWAIVATKDRGNFVQYSDYQEYRDRILSATPKVIPSEAIKDIALKCAFNLSFPI